MAGFNRRGDRFEVKPGPPAEFLSQESTTPDRYRPDYAEHDEPTVRFGDEVDDKIHCLFLTPALPFALL
jgi:hypothetical protein